MIEKEVVKQYEIVRASGWNMFDYYSVLGAAQDMGLVHLSDYMLKHGKRGYDELLQSYEEKSVFRLIYGKAILADRVPEGAVKVHLYDYHNVLRPRGSMEKESLSLSLYESLVSAFEHWTDPDYGDNPKKEELVEGLKDNLREEVETAWRQFLMTIRG
jgi:hypothetical protein